MTAGKNARFCSPVKNSVHSQKLWYLHQRDHRRRSIKIPPIAILGIATVDLTIATADPTTDSTNGTPIGCYYETAIANVRQVYLGTATTPGDCSKAKMHLWMIFPLAAVFIYKYACRRLKTKGFWYCMTIRNWSMMA